MPKAMQFLQYAPFSLAEYANQQNSSSHFLWNDKFFVVDFGNKKSSGGTHESFTMLRISFAFFYSRVSLWLKLCRF